MAKRFQWLLQHFRPCLRHGDGDTAQHRPTLWTQNVGHGTGNGNNLWTERDGEAIPVVNKYRHCHILLSGTVANMGEVVGIALPSLYVQKLFPLPVPRTAFWISVVCWCLAMLARVCELKKTHKCVCLIPGEAVPLSPSDCSSNDRVPAVCELMSSRRNETDWSFVCDTTGCSWS